MPDIVEANSPTTIQILLHTKGPALWPERFPESRLKQIEKTLGSYYFSALYGGSPSPEGGGHYQRSWFEYYDKIVDGSQTWLKLAGRNGNTRTFGLHHCRRFLTVDLAFSMKTEADYTVIAPWAVTPDCDLALLDVHRERMTGDKLAPSIKNMVLKWDCEYAGIEDVQAQTLVVQTMRRQGLAVRALKANMDKITRSIPAQIRMESGQVWFPRSHPELDNFEHELLTFPKGAHDDCADVLAYAALEVQRFGGAALSDEERARLDAAEADRIWAEKLEKQKQAHADFDRDSWYLTVPSDPESRFWS